MRSHFENVAGLAGINEGTITVRQAGIYQEKKK